MKFKDQLGQKLSSGQIVILVTLTIIACAVLTGVAVAALNRLDAQTAESTYCLGYCQRTGYRLDGFENCMNSCKSPASR